MVLLHGKAKILFDPTRPDDVVLSASLSFSTNANVTRVVLLDDARKVARERVENRSCSETTCKYVLIVCGRSAIRADVSIPPGPLTLSDERLHS